MRSHFIAVALLVAAPAWAQPATGPAPAPPKVFQQAGYAEPEVGAAACKVVSAGETQCVVPAMTAGVYLVRAAGASTAQAADAAQQLTIVAGDKSCNSTRSPDPKTPWAVGVKRTFVSGCVFTIVTDAPLMVTAIYLDAKALRDPKGPELTLTREPWSGVLDALPLSVKQP